MSGINLPLIKRRGNLRYLASMVFLLIFIIVTQCLKLRRVGS